MDFRTLTAIVLSPALALTGYRFDKSFRWADSGYKAWVYRTVSTIRANYYADRLSRQSD